MVLTQPTKVQTCSPLQSQDIRCAAQILVVDHEQGHGYILADTVGRLLTQDVILHHTCDHMVAVDIFQDSRFDLVIIGLESNRPDNIALVPYFRDICPELPVLVVANQIHHRTRDRALEFGADAILTLPRRAGEMKALLQKFATDYLLF